MAKGNSTNTSSTNTSFSPSMNFGAPTPGEVANNAGLGPFGTVNWSGPSSTTPAKDNAAEVETNKPTTPTIDTSNFAPVEGKGAVVSEEVFANNPVENAVVESDFSWVTDSKWNPEYETTHWDNKAEQAREVAGYNQRKARNWTYEGDWRATDKPVYTMVNGTVIPNYDKERKYDKFIAPLEMNKAWKEANENIVAKNNIAPKNNIESISNALKAAGKDAGKINQEFAIINPEVTKEFSIGGKVGKNFKDVEKDYQEAFRNYEAAKELKDADKEKEAKEALEKSKKAMRDQIALENKVANETMNEFIEMVNKPDVPGLGKGIAKSAIEYNNTKIGDMTVYVTKSDADENAVNVTFVTPDGREVDIGQVGTEGYAGSFSNESLASRRDALKSQIDLIGKTYEKSLVETPLVPETKEEVTAETPEEATIAPEVTPETKEVTLNDVEEDINNIDVSKIENIKQAEEVNAKIEQTFTKLEVTARNQLETLVTDLMNEGKSLQAIKESPAFKSLATQIFRVAQNIYDKVNDVEEYTNRYFGDIDISSKHSIKKNADKISMRIDQMENKISPYMSKEDINALAKYSKSVDATKDAAIALMKAAAFNGAENVKGGFWSDAYKAEKAEVKGGFKEGGKDLAAKIFGGKDSGKLTWGDWVAASIKGTAGVTATILGFAMMAVNPVAGTMLALSGIKTAAETGMKMALDVTRSKSTNEEAMFGSGENYVGKTIMNNIYNRSFEEANIGDPKSVATYTTVSNMLRSLVEISTGNNLNIISAINTLKDGISNLAHGGMKGRTDALVNNVFALGKNIVEWANMNPNIISGISSEKGNNNSNNNYNNPSTSYNFITDDIIEEDKKKPAKVVENMGSTSFGVESDSAEAAASTYSGAKEQAKNSNLATDYNAGMEQEVNEAVSDERVKSYIVKIYGSEPDFIRNAISKILTAHSEREWK